MPGVLAPREGRVVLAPVEGFPDVLGEVAQHADEVVTLSEHVLACTLGAPVLGLALAPPLERLALPRRLVAHGRLRDTVAAGTPTPQSGKHIMRGGGRGRSPGIIQYGSRVKYKQQVQYSTARVPASP